MPLAPTRTKKQLAKLEADAARDGKYYAPNSIAPVYRDSGPRPGQSAPDTRSSLSKWWNGPRGKSERGCG